MRNIFVGGGRPVDKCGGTYSLVSYMGKTLSPLGYLWLDPG